MLNNPALDVAIGLIFIYALYSLITTTLTELVSTWINIRGRVLRGAIIRMLDDEKPTQSPGKIPNGELSRVFLTRPEIKYLGNKKWFSKNSRRPSYIKPKTFGKALINTLYASYEGENNFKILISKLDDKNPTHEFLINLISEAKNNTDKFKSLAEEWYNETMERVSGWYKKWIQLITFMVSLFIAFSMNVNTIEIAQKLSTDDEARIELVNAATNFLESQDDSTIMSLNKEELDKIKKLNTQLNDLLLETEKEKTIINLEYPNIKSEINEWWSYLLGCLITAIALSLGAPFWFDLLNRLVKLRGSGIQEKTTKNN